MGEQYYMACLLSLATLAAVIFLAWTNGVNRFNPTWIVAASTMVIMVWVIHGAMWLSRLCESIEKLLRTLIGPQSGNAHTSLHTTLQRLDDIIEELKGR